LYVVDPDGDLIIIHHAPRESFALWDHPEGLSDIGDGEPAAETIETPGAPHGESTLLISLSPPPELQFKVSCNPDQIPCYKIEYVDEHRVQTLEQGDS
jgi:hypothetical protein